VAGRQGGRKSQKYLQNYIGAFISFHTAQAAHSVTYYSFLSLADFVAATNRPSLTAFFRAKIDVALRDAYATVLGVDVLDPSDHDANLHENPAFTRDLFGLKINQGGGSFRPYSERIYFLNCMISILPQMLDMVPKEGDTKKGLWTSLTGWIGPNSFGEVNKATRWAPFSPTRKAASRRSLRAKFAV
jgi:hypothetical protein